MLAASFTAARAQVAQWAVHPNYDNLTAIGNDMFVYPKNGKYGVVGKGDKEIVPAQYDSIGHFKNGGALVFSARPSNLAGFVKEDGTFVKLEAGKYAVNSLNACFNDGYLPIRTNGGGAYHYLALADGKVHGTYGQTMPFSEGYAVVGSYEAQDKMSWGYVTADNNGPMNIIIDKNVDADDITFASAVNNGKAIVAVKKQFYEFDVRARVLIPLSVDGTSQKSSLVMAESKRFAVMNDKDGWQVTAKNGVFYFDKQMRLTSYKLQGKDTTSFNVKEQDDSEPPSPITVFGDPVGGKVAMGYDDNLLLPHQFDNIEDAHGNTAVVRKDGKYGAVSVDPNAKFAFKLNEGKPLAFEHGTHKSTLITTLPSSISPAKARVTSLMKECELKTETRTDNQNVEISSISYDCILTMGDDISEESQPTDYTFSITCDGLQSKPYTVTLNERYVKGYVVELTNEVFKDQVGEISFDVLPIGTDYNEYQKKVELRTNSADHIVVVSKTAEDSYRAKIYGLDSNAVAFDIIVTEEGCPSIRYEFLEKLPTSSAASTTTETKRQGTSTSKSVARKSGNRGSIARKAAKTSQANKSATPKTQPLFIPE